MSDCTSIQKSLKWCEGASQYPGVKKRLYYLSKSDIVKFPPLKKDSVVYEGAFVLAADKKWLCIDIIPSKSQLTSEPQGEYPSQTQLNKLTALHPGVDEASSAASLYLNNNDSVFLVPTMTGKYRVVGCDMWEGKITVQQDQGQGATGTAGTTIAVEATDIAPSPFYEGKIETEDGDFMADGSPIAGE